MTIAWSCEKWQSFKNQKGHFDPPPPPLGLIYEGQVIDNQRLVKVTKKATHYPQVSLINLETLSFYCLTSVKNWVNTKQKQRMRFFFRKFYISSMTFCRKKQKWRKYENVRCNLKWKHCTNNLSYVGLRHVSPCAVSPCAVKKPLWFHEKDSPSKPSLKSNRSKYLVFHTNENELTPRNYINTSIEKIVKWLHYPLWFDEKKKNSVFQQPGRCAQ